MAHGPDLLQLLRVFCCIDRHLYVVPSPLGISLSLYLYTLVAPPPTLSMAKRILQEKILHLDPGDRGSANILVDNAYDVPGRYGHAWVLLVCTTPPPCMFARTLYTGLFV
jgi:hypothetical protein